MLMYTLRQQGCAVKSQICTFVFFHSFDNKKSAIYKAYVCK